MKRFLSFVLSALFVFQAGNASCDARSRWDERKVICVDVSGKSVQPQGLIVPYIPQQHNITIEQPEMNPNINVKVDATTFANKLLDWLKIVLAGALGYALLKTCWPVIKFLTGISNPLDTVKGWGEGAVKWVKGIWNEGGEETLDSNNPENVNSIESGWGASLLKNVILPLTTLVMMKGSRVGKSL